MHKDVGVTAVFGALVGVSLTQAFNETSGDLLSITAAALLLFFTVAAVYLSSLLKPTAFLIVRQKKLFPFILSILGSALSILAIGLIYGYFNILDNAKTTKVSYSVALFLFLWASAHAVESAKTLKDETKT